MDRHHHDAGAGGRCRRHQIDAGLGSRDLEDDVRALAAGGGLDRLGDIRLLGIHRRHAQLLGDGDAVGVDLRQGHIGAGMLGNQGDQHADGPAAYDQHVLAGLDPSAFDVVAGHRHRFDQGRMAQVDAVRQGMHRVGRDGPFLLKGAVGIEPEEFQVLADMLVPPAAGRAVAAMVEGAHHHVLSGCDAADVLSDRRHHPRHLMADHPVMADALVHMAEIDMQVGAADAAIADIDLDVVGAGRNGVLALHREGLAALVIGRRNLHRVSFQAAI